MSPADTQRAMMKNYYTEQFLIFLAMADTNYFTEINCTLLFIFKQKLNGTDAIS